MRQWISLILSALMLTAVYGQTIQFGPQHKPQNEVLDEIGLVVNDEVLTRRQLNLEMAALRQQVKGNSGLSEEQMSAQLLERVIMKHLLDQLSTKSGLAVSASDIDLAVKQVAEQNNLDVPSLLKQVKRDTGLDEKQFRAQLAKDIAMQQLRQGIVGRDIRITEAQINDQIAQIARAEGSTLHIEDLLVPVPEGDVSERGQQIESIIAMVAEVVRQNGELKTAAANIPGAVYNDLGTISLAQIPPRFTRALANLSSGEMVSSPIVDDDGMHFLKVVSKTDGTGSYQVVEANVAHILLRVNGEGESAAQKVRIDEIYRQLQQGANFAEMAKRYSDDTSSAIRGGQLGWVSADNMVPEFAEQMANVDINVLTPPFRSVYGWHILKVKERRMADRSEDKLREQIRQGLLTKYVEDAWQQRLLELRQEAYVEIR